MLIEKNKQLIKQILNIIYLFLTCNSLKAQTLVVNPNPFVNRTLASYTIVNSDTASLYIVDQTGKNAITFFTNVLLNVGNFQDSIIMDGFPAGIYYLSLSLKKGNSRIAKMVKTGALGLSEFDNGHWVSIYPNPVNDKLFLETNGSEIIQLQFLNLFGQTVYSKIVDNQNQTIDVSFLSKGIYFVKIVGTTKQELIRIIKD